MTRLPLVGHERFQIAELGEASDEPHVAPPFPRPDLYAQKQLMGELKPNVDEGAMKEHIVRWQNSGQSMAAYCRSSGIKSWVFRYWYRKLEANAEKTAEKGDHFVEISGPPEGLATPAFACIRLCDGRELIFHQEVSADYVRAVLGW